MRRIAALLLLFALAPGTWLRSPPVPPSNSQVLVMRALPLPDRAVLRQHLGPFELEGIWQLQSANSNFGGYSALLALGDGQMMALSDLGYYLRFSQPGARQERTVMRSIMPRPDMAKANRDCESATRDSATGTIWLGWEGRNLIGRYGADLAPQAAIQPPAMRDWDDNLGPEAMVRLSDGRFVVLAEGFSRRFEDRRHEGLLFPRDPASGVAPERFTLSGPARFSPVDMAQMPDGRVLVLMRRAVWPFPFRFAGRLALADPAEIRPGGEWHAHQVASLTSSLPVDNFEGMAIEPRSDGKLTVWLISDDNRAITQRTLLWKLVVDPVELR